MTQSEGTYHMPAEWSRHLCTFMEWPNNEATWRDSLDNARVAYAQVARTIARLEPVIMIAQSAAAESASAMCGPSVRVLEMEHDDSWARDNGPTFLINNRGEIAGVNWIFNAWGLKSNCWSRDDQVAPLLLRKLGIPCFDAPIVLEGGSIHVDGEGTLLTTEECLLNPNRNPRLTRAEIEAALGRYLGIDKVIWLKYGLHGDETDGHVDNTACFAGPGRVLMQVCNDPADPNYERTLVNMGILEKATDARGRRLEIIQVEQPPAAFHNGKRLPMSYINFYLANGGLIYPFFGGGCKQADRNAEAVLRSAFPDRTVVGVAGTNIIRGGGNIHCITQQMPAGKLENFDWRVFDAGTNYGRGSNELRLEYR